MPKINFLKTIEDSNIDEKDIQRSFEQNLESIEEGLEPIASFLSIGTGIIDTLALDEDNNPVIIEFKRIGNFDRDALIQVMNYYSWFVSDGNHKLYIKNIIKKQKPDVDEVGDDLRIIIVVSYVEDELKSACWALEPSIKLVTYSISEGNNEELYLSPRVELDTSREDERTVNPPKSEDDHFRGKDKMRLLYNILIQKIKQNIDANIKPNPSPQYYIGLANRKNFCAIKAKNQHLIVELLLSQNEANNPRFKQKYPNSKWGKIMIASDRDVNDELIIWIKLAYNKAP